jgi:hypothetical protein
VPVVSRMRVFIRVCPTLGVEDWYLRSGGTRHLLSMIIQDEEPDA